MNKVDKKYWRKLTKRYCFSAKKVRRNNEYLLNHAAFWRIVSIGIKNVNSKYCVIEGWLDGKWHFLKGTDVLYSTPENHWFRDYKNAYNRCVKLARKFPEIGIHKLLFLSDCASYDYRLVDYRNDVTFDELNIY